MSGKSGSGHRGRHRRRRLRPGRRAERGAGRRVARAPGPAAAERLLGAPGRPAHLPRAVPQPHLAPRGPSPSLQPERGRSEGLERGRV